MGIINNTQIIYENSKSFYWASKFLPKKILKKVINIYAFCRLQDDLVDEGIKIEDSSELEELENIIKSYGVSKNIISNLMEGINSDKNFKRFKDNSELLRYCYKVAGVVGLMMIKALDIKQSEAKYFAIDLGMAMQLTNISRDIMQDYKKNRIYIPENTGINKDIISNMTSENEKKIKKVVNQIILKSEIYYKSSLNGMRYIPIRSRLAILVSLRIYQGIGIKIIKTEKKFIHENLYVTNIEKTLIVAKALIEFLIFFIFPIYKKKHNIYLHESLEGLYDIHR
ncbi:squalene/phytoene synthase family protein [Gammaproteobacteria bacterium]|jgi:15-cis-phytoene synthase|nr:squalene/phytoene synthase family protein [Gammaproteobacteria bacterium]MDA9896604.1 squalene/phytoene synthase family protein [Gammaproteobacteria bacterium]